MTNSINKNYQPNDKNVSNIKIAKAFRWSVIIFILLACSLVILVWFMNKTSKTLPTSTKNQADMPLERKETKQNAIPNVHFSDITEVSGINFKHFNGAYGDKLLPETMGGGVAFFDYDNDNDADLLFVNGSNWPGKDLANEPASSLTLFANDGRGNFIDVTRQSGLNVKLYGMGVAIADYDGDGDQDIYITAVGYNKLFQNNSGVFSDVSKKALVQGKNDEWSSSAAFFDADGDNDLDLFVANYVQWSRNIDYEVNYRLTGIGRAYGPPANFAGQHSRLYLNNGDNSFTDYSADSHIRINNPASKNAMGKSLSVYPIDIDNDGLMDIVVTNDTVKNFVFHNLGNARFEEVGELWGMAFDRNGKATGAMGIDSAWFNNDQSMGLAIGNFANEMSSFYVAFDDPTFFSDQSIVDGIGPASRSKLTFGLFFFDYDLDGRMDLFQANGHIENEINIIQKSMQYKQTPQLFWNNGEQSGSSFAEYKPSGDNALNKAIVGRGAAYADIDSDGDLDIIVTQINDKPMLLRNDQQLGNHWLHVKLSQPGKNPDAIGSRIRLTLANGDILQQQIMPSRSYLSQVLPMAYFGLGKNPLIKQLEVIWPDSSKQILHNIRQFDRLIKIQKSVNPQ